MTEIEDPVLHKRLMETNNPEIFNELGAQAALRQDFPKAIKYFKKCLEISPNCLPAAINYAEVLKSLNLLYTALPLWEKLKETYPNNSEVAAYLEEGRWQKGLKFFTDIHRREIRGLPVDEKLRELARFYLDAVSYNCLLGELGQKISALNKISMLHFNVLCLLFLFSKYRSGNVLEIGPYIGGSTIAMALGKEAAGANAKIISIEAGGQYPEHPDIPSNDIIGDLKKNLREFAMTDRVEILEGHSNAEHILKTAAALLNKNQDKAGVLFIDADGNIMRDINNYKQFLAKDCILVVDDYVSTEFHNKDVMTREAIDGLKNRGFIIEFGVYGWGTWVGQFNESFFHELPYPDFSFEGYR
jgi:predicted O-methyltransferase YrrM